MSAPESSPIPDRLYYGPNGHTSRYPSKVVVTAEYIRADLCPKQELAGDMFVSTEPDGSRWVQHADALKMEAEIEALRTENALLSALLEPQKPMRADEVTEPGFYWWSQGGVVEIDIEYSTEHPKRLMLWSTGIEEGINLAGTFVGPLRMPEEV